MFFPLQGVTEGYNGTIFAYGQTGCGKSFSMQGITDPATQRGIIPRWCTTVFIRCRSVEYCLIWSTFTFYVRDLFLVYFATAVLKQRHCFCRAFDHVFETIQIAEGTKYLVHASYLEIYNEVIRDFKSLTNKVLTRFCLTSLSLSNMPYLIKLLPMSMQRFTISY